MNLAKFFNHKFEIDYFRLYDNNGNVVYSEYPTGYWCKKNFDKNYNEIYFENSLGFWYKKIYDLNNNNIHYKDSKNFWWVKGFDDNNNLIYHEDSIDGIVFDVRPKQSCDNKIVEIDGRKYRLQEI